MSNQQTYEIPDLKALDGVAADLWNELGHYGVFLLTGDLGAGKTTLVQSIGKLLDVTDEILSPTYTLVNEYATANGGMVYHADLYRLKSTEEALEVGMEDYLYSGSPCFVEWPAVIEPILPAKFVRLALSNHPNGTGRILRAERHG